MNDNIKNKVDSIDKSKLNAKTKEIFEKIVIGLRSKDPKVSDKSEELLDKIIANAKAKNSDIFIPEKTSKASVKGTQSQVNSRRQQLFDAIEKDPQLKGFNKFQSIIEIDAERVALPRGKRVSKKGWKNQYGKSDGGRTYYENRENRIDRKAPITKSTSKPWLKYGGEIEEGKYVITVTKDGVEKLAMTKNSQDEAMSYATLKKNVIGSNGVVKVYNDEKECLYTSSYKDGGYMAEGGKLGDINTELINVKNNIMGTTTLEMKIKGMRKPQNFIVYPISADQSNKPIMIQSDTRFGFLDLSTGEGLMSQSHANGAYSYHYQSDKKVPFKLSETDVQRIKSDLSKKASSKVGNSVIFSDNSGANMMAEGGMINHGFRSGDKIIEIYKGYGIIESKDVVEVINPSQGSRYVVDHGNTMDEQIDGAKRMIDNMTPIELVDRIEIGTDRNGSMDRRGVEYAEGGYMSEGGETEEQGVDLFEDYEDQPKEVSDLLETLDVEDYNYDTLNDLLSKMKKIGYTFEFGLDAEPYDLRKIGQKGKSEYYAKGGKLSHDKYIGRKDVRLIIIKNPNKKGKSKYLQIDKSGFLNGINEFGKGGSLTSKGYVYIKRENINQAVYYDKNQGSQIIHNPKNGFWVSKDALIKAGMNEMEVPKPSNPNIMSFEDFKAKLPDVYGVFYGDNGAVYKAKYDKYSDTYKYFKNGRSNSKDKESITRTYHQYVYFMEQGKDITKPLNINNSNAKNKSLEVAGDDFSFLLDLSDTELSKRLDLVREQQKINGKQYLEAKKNNENTKKIEEAGERLANQERAIIEARLKKSEDKQKDKFTYEEKLPISDMKVIKIPKSFSDKYMPSVKKLYYDKSSNKYYFPDFEGRIMEVKNGYTLNKISEELKMADGGHIGFEGLAEKVAKKYEGMKVPSKYQKEYGKTYSKEEAKEVGNKVAYSVHKKQGKMAEGGETEWFDYSKSNLKKLPYNLNKYFTKTPNTQRIPMEKIKPTRAREKGVINANEFMMKAYNGQMEKRKPITVRRSNGKFVVLDGNSTFANAKNSGWKYIYAEIEKTKHKAPAGESVFILAKRIRQDGEKWQDAVKRANLMKKNG